MLPGRAGAVLLIVVDELRGFLRELDVREEGTQLLKGALHVLMIPLGAVEFEPVHELGVDVNDARVDAYGLLVMRLPELALDLLSLGLVALQDIANMGALASVGPVVYAPLAGDEDAFPVFVGADGHRLF